MTGILDRITYVEDEPDIREVAQIALHTLGGFTLDVCENGATAIDRAPEFEPDLILLDVMMPEMDGVETYGKLREIPKLRTTPIIFMTAKAQPREVERYKELGALGVITKPFDPITLSDEIREIWNTNLAGEAMSEGNPLQALLVRHCSSLGEDIQKIEHILSKAIHAHDRCPELFGECSALVHKLNGSSGSLGFLPLSNAARSLEDELNEIARSQKTPDDFSVRRAHRLFTELKEVLQNTSPRDSRLFNVNLEQLGNSSTNAMVSTQAPKS